MKSREETIRRDARAIARAGIDAAEAAECIRRSTVLEGQVLGVGRRRLRLASFERVYLVSVGKAASPMAAALERILDGTLTGGIVVTKHGHAGRHRKLQVIEAGHPVPNEAGVEAARQVEDLARTLSSRDLLIFALSGGASALLSAPEQPLTLADKQDTTDALLRAGADIFELNAVRKHLSSLKGGRLAALAYPATVIGLLLSDVIGDPHDVIGSGPTAPDASTFREALSVIDKYWLRKRLPKSVIRHLEEGLAGSRTETPKAGSEVFRHVYNVVVGSNRLALDAAASKAKELGYRPLVLTSTLQGETRHAAMMHAQILRECVRSGSPSRVPCCLISGGETTVTVTGTGKGGRNQEFVLAAALAMKDLENVVVLSVGTDGTDGPTDAAGALADGKTVARGAELQLSAAKHLEENDAYGFFDPLGDLIKTGPTGTNVMDVHLLLAGSSGAGRGRQL